jgi:hypothetical protein
MAGWSAMDLRASSEVDDVMVWSLHLRDLLHRQ